MNVCVLCGVCTHSALRMDTYSPHASPLGRNYDRFARFQGKVDKLLGIGTVPKATDPVWTALEKAGGMKTPHDVRRVLRRCRVNNKHYDCIKTFCDVFTPFRCNAFHTLKTKEFLEMKFKDIQSRWREKTNNFFSYNWLLRKFLESYDSPLVAYLKPPTNKRREKRYIKMLQKLFTAANDCKTSNRMPVTDHLHCASMHLGNPPSQ